MDEFYVNLIQSTDEPTFADCSDAFNSTVGAQNGIYKLYSGKHYCFMEALPGCGGGGWTIAAQMNGSLVSPVVHMFIKTFKWKFSIILSVLN